MATRSRAQGTGWRNLVWMGGSVLAIACSSIDSKANLIDSDGDGSPDVRDCEPDNPDIAPGLDEICDGIDQDCDGEIDENPIDATEEVCDGLDNDCDGEIDEGLAIPYYPDEDGDGFGDGTLPTESCTPIEGQVEDGTDCDDTNADVYPEAIETCDGIDNNCNSEVDEGLTSTFYADTDGDGFGDATATAERCEAGEGYLADATDCDDGDGSIYPGAPESCNDGIDQDCDSVDTYCLIYGDMDLSPDADITFAGLSNTPQTGRVVGFAGDIDGDGSEEVFVSSPAFQNGSSTRANVGRVDLVSMEPSFTRGIVNLTNGSGTGWSSVGIIGAERHSYITSHATGAGDVDGDGLQDFVVGNTVADAYHVDGGAGYLVLGSTLAAGTLLVTEADTVFSSERGYQRIGSAFYPAGDLNGDGFDDLLIGAEGPVFGGGSTPGALMVWLGCEDGLGACNDSDGDGVYESTHAWGDWATPATVDYYLTGIGDSSDLLGSAIAADFDLNADGYSDLLLGARGAAGGAGEAYLIVDFPFSTFAGRSQAEHIFVGEDASDALGSVVHAPGDLDGDGYDDLILGSPKHAASTGAIYIFLGRDNIELSLLDRELGVEEVDFKLNGEVEGEQFGASIASSGDVDGDGIAELMVGAPTAAPDGLTGAGEVRILRGPPAADMADAPLARLSGNVENGAVGISVEGGTDLNGDGWTEILVGASGYDGSGSAFLLFGGYHP